VIDLHSHVLAGVDDGARDLSESLAMLRVAAADGITSIAATPHVRDDFPTSPETMERLVADLRREIQREQLPIDVLPGGELALRQALELPDAQLRRFGLGGNPALLLLEFPYVSWPLGLEELVLRLRRRGFQPVVAHPERNPEVQVDPARLGSLVEAGAFVQLTASSIDGRLGRTVRASARRILDLELGHLVASDAHRARSETRDVRLSAAVSEVGDALGRWLAADVPAALLAGEQPPPRPLIRQKRRSLFGLRRS
jgi:protein-tyrosine phosphatase